MLDRGRLPRGGLRSGRTQAGTTCWVASVISSFTPIFAVRQLIAASRPGYEFPAWLSLKYVGQASQRHHPGDKPTIVYSGGHIANENEFPFQSNFRSNSNRV
jgi:hypothetical protein